MAEELGGRAPGWRRSIPGGGLLANLGFAAVLLPLLGVVYAPSLAHTPRADHWDFLLDTMDQDSFLDIFAHSYSYNRTRRVAPGDTELFRPLLFAVLAAEKALFGTHFAGYQAAGILLHWGVACLLLVLLQTVLAFQRGTAGDVLPPPWASRLLPYAVCLFFAFNKSVQELVIWSHLHGYLLFLILLLGSLTLLLRCALRPAIWKSPWLWGSWVLALLAAFTYEMGQFYAVLAGLFLAVALPAGTARARRWAFGGLFAAVLAIYQGADRLDRWVHQGQFDPTDARPQILIGAFSTDTVVNTARFLAYTVLQPFFPSICAGGLAGGHVNMEEVDWGRHFLAPLRPGLAGSVLTTTVAAGLGVLGLVQLFRQSDKRSLWMFLLAASLYGVYMASIVLGRMNLRPWLYLSRNSYYAHTGLLLALIPAFAAWLAVGRSWGATAGQAVLLLGLVALSGYAAPAVWRLTTTVAGDLNGCRDGGAGFARRIARVEDFIRQHSAEADFSLGFDFDSCNAIGAHHGVPITTILFKRHLRSSPPKYVVAFPHGEPSPMTYAQWRRSCGPDGRLCPELVAFGPHYNYFRVDGRYYGVQQWDGCYDPARHDHAYLIEDQTLEGAMQQQETKLAEQDAYIRGGWFLPPESPITLTGRWARGVQPGRGPRRDCLVQPREKWAHYLSRVLHDSYSCSYWGSAAGEGKAFSDRAPPAISGRPR